MFLNRLQLFGAKLLIFLLGINLANGQIHVDTRSEQRINWAEDLLQFSLRLQSETLENLRKAETIQFGSWFSSEPYTADDREALFDSEFAPEIGQEVKWKKLSNKDGELHEFRTDEFTAVYLKRTINTNRQMSVPFYLGTNSGYKIWLNGEMITSSFENNPESVIMLPFDANLRKGENELFIKLASYDDSPSFNFMDKPGSSLLTELVLKKLQSLHEEVGNDFERRKLYWEVEYKIWEIDLDENVSDQLVRNYLGSIRNDSKLGKVLSVSNVQSTLGHIEVLRKVFQVDQLSKQLDYIASNYHEGDESWTNYKNQYSELMITSTDRLARYVKDISMRESAIKSLDSLIGLGEIMPIRLPSSPMKPGKFGAFYTKLKYYPDWDKKWRVHEHADVVVRFPDDNHKFVFWRGTNYIPHWVTEKGFWFNNEFNETWFSEGSAEPMSDKQCRYSHIRIVHSSPARAVVHWRYALNDVNYDIAWPDDFTGWGDWSDEYYYIYPDATSTRKVVLHTSYFEENPSKGTDEAGHEWQEGIMVYHPYTKPEDYLNIDAVHVANMNGNVGKWSWKKHGQPTTPTPTGSNIVMMNTKSRYKPFISSQLGVELAPYEGAQGGSHFRWRDHWPTTTEPTPGRNANGKQAAHGSFFHVLNIPYHEKSNFRFTKIMLHGLSKTSVEGLVPVTRSWLTPPKVVLASNSAGVEFNGYDISEKAYKLSVRNNDPGEIRLEVKATSENVLVNPVFVIDNWLKNGIEILINGNLLEKGTEFNIGLESDLEGDKLVLWINQTLTETTNISLR